MKVRSSGIRKPQMWDSLFDIDMVLRKLQVDSHVQMLAEVGSGLGTFTIPAAKKISGKVYAFDIDEEMIAYLNQRLEEQQIKNVIPVLRDVLDDTTGLDNNTVDYVMLFNILHYEKPEEFFNEAYRILNPGGKIGIMHWRSDITTPGGPEMSIRPKPEDILNHIDDSKFEIIQQPLMLEPYHYGMVIAKK